MTEKQISIVKNSWSFVIVHSEQAGEIFYNKLFEIDPSLKVLFNNDMQTQSRKLVAMVTVVVTKLHKLDDIIAEVNALSKRHISYGTKPEHYVTVGKALLWMLEQGVGDRWTEEMKQAWETVYAILANTMKEASQ